MRGFKRVENWKISYDCWLPSEQALRETLCTLGNGYFATRGAAEESSADGTNYPGTYYAGGYNRLSSEIKGRVIENEDLVNWPNWLLLSFRYPNGKWLNLADVQLIFYYLELDLKKGVLLRHFRFRDQENRETTMLSRRFVSMDQPHIAAISWELTPENWSGPIEICSALDGNISNQGVARYRQLESKHLIISETGGNADEETIYLVAETNQSRIRMAQAAKTKCYVQSSSEVPRKRITRSKDKVAYHLLVNAEEKQAIRIEKTVAIYTSRDLAISEPLLEARNALERATQFSELLGAHRRAWNQLWQRCDLTVSGTARTQELLRLHIFHLLQTISKHTIDLDVGIPARGWHGEAYRGHVFWDELFIFPFLNLHLPELAGELMMYRYRRLPEARYAAHQAGYRGAMFPWQSGSNGREESQVMHLNPHSGHWLPDDTFLQRHINSAVAFNLWQYFQTSGDLEFMKLYGAEIIFSIALFWSSMASWSEEKQRFEINGVVGPDEYHTSYPGSDKPGINNNAYTNVMAVWVLQFALELPELIDHERIADLYENLHISEEETTRWRNICRQMFIPFSDENKAVISQFEGYENLPELDWKKYRQADSELLRLDRLLEAEGKNVNDYRASKQADVLMLFYLFSTDKLTELFALMGYEFRPEFITANIKYYEPRTSHGSTLSTIVHAWVKARADRKCCWDNFQTSLLSDVEDLQGGTTTEGIHLGAMAGSVDLVQRCFTGLVIEEDNLLLNPVLPDNIYFMEMPFRYRGYWFNLRITQEKLIVKASPDWKDGMAISICGRKVTFKPDEIKEFNL